MLMSGLHSGSAESESVKVESGNLYVDYTLGDSNTS